MKLSGGQVQRGSESASVQLGFFPLLQLLIKMIISPTANVTNDFLLFVFHFTKRFLAILAQPMFHVEGMLAIGILHQALQLMLLAMR